MNNSVYFLLTIYTIPIYLIKYINFFSEINLYFGYTYFNITEINLYLGYIYSTISAFLLLVLLPPIYFKIKGRDFYNEMEKYFAIRACLKINLEKFVKEIFFLINNIKN